MTGVADKAQDTIRKTATRAKELVDKAGSVFSRGVKQARKAVKRTGEKWKDAGQKLEDGA